MPPKRRGRPAGTAATTTAPAQTETEAEVATDNDPNDSDSHDGDPGGSDEEQEQQQVRFFNTTFSTFRVSPLYIAQQPLTPTGLELLSRRLRDTLVGDVVRGVPIALESDSTLGSAGALERVEWRECDIGHILPTLAGKERTKHRPRARTRSKQEPRRILELELDYENVSFSALMLPRLEHDEGRGGRSQQLQDAPSWAGTRSGSPTSENGERAGSFAHFPLLLVRMPAPLKAVLLDFLSSTFDCRISPLHLGTRTLIRSWEHWIENGGVAEGKALKKDLGLTLGFHLEPPLQRDVGGGGTKSPSSTDTNTPNITRPRPETPATVQIQLGLKTMDIVVPAKEVRRFLHVHTNTKSSPPSSRKRPTDATEHASDRARARTRRRKLAGGKDEEGWAWREETPGIGNNNNGAEKDSFSQPFTEALALYLNHHLALDLFHPGVRVLRVVCDAFALSDGRVKIFAPASTSTSRSRGGKGAGNDEGEGEGQGQADAAIEAFMRNLVRRAQGSEWSQSALHLTSLVAAER